MSTDLSEQELKAIIADAEQKLQQQRRMEQQKVIDQIHELAASIGVKATVKDKGKSLANKPSRTVAIKYRDAANPENTWTGRGRFPKWLQEKIDQGHTPVEFLA